MACLKAHTADDEQGIIENLGKLEEETSKLRAALSTRRYFERGDDGDKGGGR